VHGWRFGIYIDWDGDTTSYDLHRVSFYIVFVKYINRREKSIQNKVLLIYSIHIFTKTLSQDLNVWIDLRYPRGFPLFLHLTKCFNYLLCSYGLLYRVFSLALG
jgi:hypothetical protein